MQHNRSGRKLGRTTSHRLALFRNQLASLVISERIRTTLPKAKELRPLAERMVTQARRGTIHSRRLVGRWIQDRDLIKKLFDEIAPRFADRPGGYLRIVKLGPRIGDGAEEAFLEFVDFELKKKLAPAPAAESKADKGKEAAETDEAAEKPARPAKKPAAKKSAAPRAEKKAEPKAKPSKGPSTAKRSSAPKKVGSS
jgi:large subunit ribosomal protein L17